MSILVIDLARVLDESAEGKAGAKALAARWEVAKTEHAKLQKAAEAASGAAQGEAHKALIRFEKETLAAIEDERRTLRSSLLEKVRPLVAAVAKQRKADVVLEASSALYVAETADITQTILGKL